MTKVVFAGFRTFTIIAILLLTTNCTENSSKRDSKEDVYQKSEVINTIHSRKSVRNFIEKPVSEEDLLTLVKAGMAAPSGKNLQPWFFYIVRNRAILDNLAEELPTAKMLSSVSSAIIVCGDITIADTTAYKNYWVMDCSAASENILLTAESLGLGATWTALFPYENRIEIARRNIGIPETLIPLNIIPVGYPAGIDNPKDKWNEGRVKIIR